MSFSDFKLLVCVLTFSFLKLSLSFVLPNPKNLIIHLDFEKDLMDQSGNSNHGNIAGPDTITYK